MEREGEEEDGKDHEKKSAEGEKQKEDEVYQGIWSRPGREWRAIACARLHTRHIMIWRAIIARHHFNIECGTLVQFFQSLSIQIFNQGCANAMLLQVIT